MELKKENNTDHKGSFLDLFLTVNKRNFSTVFFRSERIIPFSFCQSVLSLVTFYQKHFYFYKEFLQLAIQASMNNRIKNDETGGN